MRNCFIILALTVMTGCLSGCLRQHPVHCGRALNGLDSPCNFKSKRASSADPNWSNGNKDYRSIEPGQTLTLAELEGPGRIAHLRFTIEAKDPEYPRKLTLRIYWDGSDEPAVESPLGDFFAVGHGLLRNLNSEPVAISAPSRHITPNRMVIP